MPARTRIVAAIVTLLALGACSSGQLERPEPVRTPPASTSPKAAGRLRHVLFISVDTLRADRLGCYGRLRAGTPNIDALAASGVLFEDAMATAPLTLPSHAAMLTGQQPMRHLLRHNGLHALPEGVTTLAERLRSSGMRTGAFVGSVVLARRYGLAQGFDTYTEPAEGGAALMMLADRPFTDVNRDAAGWIGSSTEPFLAWVHFMEPHFPYAPPTPEAARFPDDPYQGEVSAADRAVGELLDALRARGVLDDTLVIVTSDHGEDLGDHGENTHGIFLYQSTLHVPLVMSGPGLASGVRVSAPVSIVDISPTILDLLGHGTSLAEGQPLDGVSLASVARGLADSVPSGPPARFHAETFMTRLDYGWSELRALRRGREKVIESPRPELYDVEGDPREGSDLAASSPERLAALRSALAEVIATTEGRESTAPAVQLSAEEREALQSLGYLNQSRSAATAPAQGEPLPNPRDRLPEVMAMELADHRMREGNPAEAERLLRDLLAKNPAFAEARVSHMMSLLMLGRSADARASFAELEGRVKGTRDAHQVLARAHLILAGLALQEGKRDEAIHHHEQALRIPLPSVVSVALAKLYIEAGRPADARKWLVGLESRGELDMEGAAILRTLPK